jgi:RNase P protein component
VVRNRLRRRLRALLSAAPPPPGLYLVGARPDVVGRSYAELQFDLGRLLRQLASPTPTGTTSTTGSMTTTTTTAMRRPSAAALPGS